MSINPNRTVTPTSTELNDAIKSVMDKVGVEIGIFV